ncbi:MAG: hypothetical protein LQ352_000363 [Teloschistes flavicans]|nr:MAG: hypothetical protein LQ352_000363 [Teloschistes flavicans]
MALEMRHVIFGSLTRTLRTDASLTKKKIPRSRRISFSRSNSPLRYLYSPTPILLYLAEVAAAVLGYWQDRFRRLRLRLLSKSPVSILVHRFHQLRDSSFAPKVEDYVSMEGVDHLRLRPILLLLLLLHHPRENVFQGYYHYLPRRYTRPSI